MPLFNAVIFDHDGTIVDSAPGIRKSANAAFAELGFPLMEMPQFMPFLGPPLTQSFMDFAGMDFDQAQRAIAIYRREYNAGNCFCLDIYPGMERLLRKLRAAGVKTAVASSKPTVYLEKILSGIGLRGLFDTVCGVDLGRLDESKADTIAAAARAVGVPHGRCLMVGDRRFDAEGAAALGMPCAGALYGYGTQQELEQAGATYFVRSCAELEALILPSAPAQAN